MFENISFLYLCALAFTAWVVLCYWHAIEQQRHANEYSVELYTENAALSQAPRSVPRLKAGNSDWDLLVKFVLIFLGTTLLSKLLHWLETQARGYLRTRPMGMEALEGNANGNDIFNEHELDEEDGEEEEELAATSSQEQQHDLRQQLNALQARCSQMHRWLVEMRMYHNNNNESGSNSDVSGSTARTYVASSHLYVSSGGSYDAIDSYAAGDSNMDSQAYWPSDGSNDEEAESALTVWKEPIALASSGASLPQSSSPQSLSPQSSQSSLPFSQSAQSRASSNSTQNVFISNSHIHINGEIYFSQRNINVQLRRQSPLYSRRQSEFRQVWSKFIRSPKERPMLAAWGIGMGMRGNNLLL